MAFSGCQWLPGAELAAITSGGTSGVRPTRLVGAVATAGGPAGGSAAGAAGAAVAVARATTAAAPTTAAVRARRTYISVRFCAGPATSCPQAGRKPDERVCG